MLVAGCQGSYVHQMAVVLGIAITRSQKHRPLVVDAYISYKGHQVEVNQHECPCLNCA